MAEHQFVPVSQAYAEIAIDERTILMDHITPDDPASDAVFNFDIVVREAIVSYAEDPEVYRPKVFVNRQEIGKENMLYIPCPSKKIDPARKSEYFDRNTQ